MSAGEFLTDDPFEVDAGGRTRLFYLAQEGRDEEIERLLGKLPGTGFYPQRLGLLLTRDREGLTAADLAERHGHTALADLLRYKAWAMETFG